VSPRVLALAVALALAGCAAAPPPAPVAFAPHLGVELEAMVETPSGLRYRDVVEGSGPAAGPRHRVGIVYAGFLPDGTQVDAHLDRERPVVFELGSRAMIRGLEEAVRGMRVGGQRQVVIPPRLAYGHRRVGAVPPDATLVFLVELVSVR
jgi:FKBP-type peptidyl-prolyl cis-trans isomerase